LSKDIEILFTPMLLFYSILRAYIQIPV